VVIAADYPFLDIVFTMLVFVGWMIWFSMLIMVISDIFRRHDISGWGKALWTAFVIVLPFLGVFIYLIAEGKEMAARRVADAQAHQAAFDTYVRDVAASSGPTAEIAKAKHLLDSGAISQAEFEALKQKAMA
jgi:hypothetical protein